MPAPTFRSDDEAAAHYLGLLRDGTSGQKIAAREALAGIFARRGMFEEAAELYERNVEAGVRTPELLERLSEVYRHLGEHQAAAAALAEARRLQGVAQPPVAPTPPPIPSPPPAPTPPTPAPGLPWT